MNRGRLRRYALRVLAAASLGVGLVVAATGIAHADTLTAPSSATHGKVVNRPVGAAVPAEASWG
jgi:Na+/glutamate symporter